MRKSAQILADPRCLIFFVAPYRFLTISGTLVVILDSIKYVLYPLFLRREIIKVIKNDRGMFSFQFGKCTVISLAKINATEPDNKRILNGDREISREETRSRGEERSSQFRENQENIPAKRSLKVRSPERTKGHSSCDCKCSKHHASKSYLQALQLSFISTTKSLMKAEQMKRNSIDATYREKMRIIQEENYIMKKTLELLLKQQHRRQNDEDLCAVDGTEAVASSPLHDSSRIPSPWECRWSGCTCKFSTRGSLWEHVQNHTRFQSGCTI